MPKGPLIRRHGVLTRIAHWTWAVALFFLLLTGLQIFNAHPVLYLGEQSGFGFENAILRIGAVDGEGGPVGVTEVFGLRVETTGFLGLQGDRVQAFPAALTIPSTQDLATGRVIHFFFAWVLVAALLLWGLAAVAGRRLGALVPTRADLRALPGDIADHARLRFHHRAGYGVLQKLAYAGVLFVALPLMVLTGLTMSPSFNAIFPWTLDLFGGRQTARTIHFAVMLALVAFFVVHMAMILLAGPLNEMRAIVTGWYRTDPDRGEP
jgi:thiosulfate reductase cytochrome b subunit